MNQKKLYESFLSIENGIQKGLININNNRIWENSKLIMTPLQWEYHLVDGYQMSVYNNKNHHLFAYVYDNNLKEFNFEDSNVLLSLFDDKKTNIEDVKNLFKNKKMTFPQDGIENAMEHCISMNKPEILKYFINVQGFECKVPTTEKYLINV